MVPKGQHPKSNNLPSNSEWATSAMSKTIKPKKVFTNHKNKREKLSKNPSKKIVKKLFKKTFKKSVQIWSAHLRLS